ncbi:MAG: hypothetical protein FWE05_00570 [Defluviitaleaceae bacterium]|nr:hypothetical protein [Defluviitaleaceae bacterium]
MNIGFHNFSTSPFSAMNRESNTLDGTALRNAIGTPRQQRHMRERMAEREREMQMRMHENQQIERLGEQVNHTRDRIALQMLEMREGRKEIVEIDGVETEITVALTAVEMEEAAKRLEAMGESLSSLGNQINQIHRNRAQREELAVEREAARQQAELEEALRTKEERARENAEANQPEPQTEEELEQAIANETTRHLTMVGARMDNIRNLSGTRARLQAEAARLENENASAQSRQDLWGDVREGREVLQVGRSIDRNNAARHHRDDAAQRLQRAIDSGDQDKIEAAETALAWAYEGMQRAGNIGAMTQAAAGASDNPEDYNLMDSFHGRQATSLNGRIARIDTAIAAEIGAMYRDGQVMQEEQLRLSQTQVQEAYEEDENDEGESPYVQVDVRL